MLRGPKGQRRGMYALCIYTTSQISNCIALSAAVPKATAAPECHCIYFGIAFKAAALSRPAQSENDSKLCLNSSDSPSHAKPSERHCGCSFACTRSTERR